MSTALNRKPLVSFISSHPDPRQQVLFKHCLVPQSAPFTSSQLSMAKTPTITVCFTQQEGKKEEKIESTLIRILPRYCTFNFHSYPIGLHLHRYTYQHRGLGTTLFISDSYVPSPNLGAPLLQNKERVDIDG